MKVIIDLAPAEPAGCQFSITQEEDPPPLFWEPGRRSAVDEVRVRFDDREMSAAAFRDWVRFLAEVEMSLDPERTGEVTRLRELYQADQELAAAVVSALGAQAERQVARIAELEAKVRELEAEVKT